MAKQRTDTDSSPVGQTVTDEVQPAVAEPRSGEESRLVDLDPRVLAAHPANIRFDLGDMTELAASESPVSSNPSSSPHSPMREMRRARGTAIGSWPGTGAAPPPSWPTNPPSLASSARTRRGGGLLPDVVGARRR